MAGSSASAAPRVPSQIEKRTGRVVMTNAPAALIARASSGSAPCTER